MNHSVGRRSMAALLTLPLLACGPSPTADAENSVSRWERTRDGYLHVDTGSSFRQITRCWDIGLDLSDCVWIGGTGTPAPGRDSFSAERWYTAGPHPETAGPQVDGREENEAYYSCSLHLNGGRLSSVEEHLTVEGGMALKNERWFDSRHTSEAWTLEDLLAWSKRTDVTLASPLADCELIGRIIETGGWTALTSGHWTAPLATAADGLATLSP